MQMKEVKVDQDDVPVVSVDLSFAELSVLFAAVEIKDFDFDLYEQQRRERSRTGGDFGNFLLSNMSKDKFTVIVRQMINSFGNLIDSIHEDRNPRDKESIEV